MRQAERLENVAVGLSALLRQPEIARWASSPPLKGGWSVNQILGHVGEMIPYWMDKCRLLIAASTPPVFGRDHEAEERLAGVARGANGAAQAIRGMSLAERSQKGIHIRYGEMDVAQVIEQFIVAHAEEHLSQVDTAVRG
jgi:hypothetical protein